MKTIRFILVVSVCFTLILISCSNDSGIVGKWRGGKYCAEIFKDGRIVVTDSSLGKPTYGTYKFTGNDTIQIDMEGLNPEVLKISLSRNKLVLKRANGETYAVYRRVKSFSMF